MISIAIDGPAGAGKSTIAKAVSKKLGYIYVDTGALYRTIGFYVISKGISPRDKDKVMGLLPDIDIDIKFVNGEQRVLLLGEDVSDYIRTSEISMAASDVSAIDSVRLFLLDLQKNMAKHHNVLMDGRDIGTVVLPNADVKIFLTASPEERAKRRYADLVKKLENITFEQVLEDIKTRDYNDSHRDIAPLVPAQDAVIVDTTGETLEESIVRLEGIIVDKLKTGE